MKDNIKTTDSNLKKNVFMNTIFRVLMIIVPFITAPYISRVLLSDGVGVNSYTLSLVTYFTMFAALGTVSYGTREIARRREDRQSYSKCFWEIEFISVICSAVSLLGWIIFSLCYKEYTSFLLILSVHIVATVFDISWFYAGIEKFKYTVGINLFFKILSVVLIFTLVKKPEDLKIYMLIYGTSLLLGNLSMWVFLPKFIGKAKIDRHSLKHHFKETFVYFIPTIATSLYTVLDKTLIGALISGETTIVEGDVTVTKKISELENGYYEQATKIIDMAKVVAFVSINAVVYSRASFLYKTEEHIKIKKLTLNTFNIVMFLSVGACCGLAAVAPTFVPVFFGPGYDKTIILLQILSCLVPIICLSGTLGSLYYSPVGKRKQSALFLVIGAALNLCLSVPLVLYFKSIGAAIASVAAELVISVLYFFFCKKAITFKEFFGFIWKKAVAGGLMAGFLVIFEVFLKQYIWNDLGTLFFEILLGIIIYLLFLAILRDRSIQIIVNLIKKRRRIFFKSSIHAEKQVLTIKQRVGRGALIATFLLSSFSGIGLSYYFGYTNPSTIMYASLMSLDLKTKTQKQTSFLHGTIKYDSKISSKISYNKYLVMQRRTKSFPSYYNSYLVSTFENNPVIYDVAHTGYECSWNQSKLAQVVTYWDYEYMESIGLPLFWVNESTKKANIGPKNNKASYGSYISATCAETIVKANGYYDLCGGDLSKAFTMLLDNKDFCISCASETYEGGEPVYFSINNIYLDKAHKDLINTNQKASSSQKYGNYYLSFDYWNEDYIFTFSYQIFGEGSILNFDIRDSYGNFNHFFQNVIGYDFALNDISVDFIAETKQSYRETQPFNEASKNINKKPNFIVLAFALISYVASLIFSLIYLHKFRKDKLSFLLLIPILVFAFLQLVFYFLNTTNIGLLVTYSTFNKLGNIISLISMILVGLITIGWSYYVRKKD